MGSLLPVRLSAFSPTLAVKRLTKLSPTDKKVRAFVGQLIVGSSIVSSSVSILFAVIVSPTWVLVIIPSIAFGALGVNLSSSQKTKWIPLGIQKFEKNSCWINSAFQLFTNISAFQEIVEKHVKEKMMKPLYDYVKLYQDQQSKNAKEFALNLGPLWAWLYDKTKGKQTQLESSDGSQQEDPAIFFRFILDECSKGLPLQRKITRYRDGVCVDKEPSSATDISKEELYISIEAQGHSTFHSALNAYFKNSFPESLDNKEQTKTGVLIEEVKSFTEAPEEFTLFLNRTSALYRDNIKIAEGKITNPIDIPLQFSFTKEQCPNETATYFLDGAIKHCDSESIDMGHYISYVLKNGVWYEMNDDKRAELTAAELKKAIRKEGVIFHFSKKTTETEAPLQLAALQRA